jgi:hypothetical protein
MQAKDHCSFTSRGSVSPSSSTITGAFMLQIPKGQLLGRMNSLTARCTQLEVYLICKARVPRMRARSYLVIYFVVWRGRGVLSCSFSSPSPPTTSSGASSLFSGSSSTPSYSRVVHQVKLPALFLKSNSSI